MDIEKALKNIRGLLNLKENDYPFFNLDKLDKNYEDTIESINLIVDENEPESMKYLWNHIILAAGYEFDEKDDRFTDSAKGFIKSYINQFIEWMQNSTLFSSSDYSYNVLKNINSNIEGEKIILRAGKRSDFDEYLDHLENDGDFLFYTMMPKECADVRGVANNMWHSFSFIVERKSDNKPVGLVALRPLRKDQLLTDSLEAAALSYYIYKPYRRNGYAKEALSLLLDAYFNEELYNLTRTEYKFEMEVKNNKAISISLDCSEENIASNRLAKSLGFKEEAIIHNTWYFDNRYSNSVFYFMDKEMYNNKNHK